MPGSTECQFYILNYSINTNTCTIIFAVPIYLIQIKIIGYTVAAKNAITHTNIFIRQANLTTKILDHICIIISVIYDTCI